MGDIELPVRKATRLKQYDYSSPGYYFITVCTHNKEKLLCDIVGTGLPDGPVVQLSGYGRVVKAQLDRMSDFYDAVILEKYVIMPNHLHLLLHILTQYPGTTDNDHQNSTISKFIGTFKRFTSREFGRNIWQSRSHDHVIRGEKDYQKIWMYIESNPARWEKDCFYN